MKKSQDSGSSVPGYLVGLNRGKETETMLGDNLPPLNPHVGCQTNECTKYLFKIFRTCVGVECHVVVSSSPVNKGWMKEHRVHARRKMIDDIVLG